MAIRITGMYSGLDTESIINEIASAQSVKKNKLVKEQTKLSWKQDAWKSLNSKIYSFYTNVLDNMRFQASYMKKSTKVSNPSAIQVVAGDNAANGVHSIKVDKLAKAAYLTGANLETKEGTCFTGDATLKTLNKNFSGTASYSVVGANGGRVDFEINENTTINDIVKQISSTGLVANYDQDNQRIFIQSKSTGALADFSLVANDVNGLEALASFGLLSKEGLSNSEYEAWKDYAPGVEAYDKIVAAEMAERAEAYKKQNDELEAENKYIDEINQKLVEENAKLLDELKGKPGYDALETMTSLYDKIYGKEQPTGETDDDGNPIMERKGGLKEAYEKAQEELEKKREEGASEAEIEQAEKDVEAAKKSYDEAMDRYESFKTMDENDKASAHNTELKEKNIEQINSNNEYFTYDPDTKKATGTDKLKDVVHADFQKKIDAANEAQKYADRAGATKIDAQDAVLFVDGVRYNSDNNSLTINGVTITALEETGEKEVTMTTTTDTDGIYGMIKNFFTEYNKLINEMSSLYNADAASGYEPLLSEEKKELADSEIEEWEKKIKDSLFRKDSTLYSVSNGMKNVLLKGAMVNGKQMYLSDFGINTMDYFKAKENEKSAYHIDGDKDDPDSANNADTLRQMIASDPETVMNFFSSMSQNLYDELADKMKSVKDTSSAFTVYNDKTMKKEYDAYADKIAREEKKLNELIDKWYSKFSAMETALAKLQSKNGAISGMFGG